MVYQKLKALNQNSNSLRWTFARKTDGTKKYILYGTLKPPIPPEWKKRCWRGREKGEEAKWFFCFVFSFCLLFFFLACFDLFPFVGRWQRWGENMEYGGPEGEQNWGTHFKTPKESLKKKERKKACRVYFSGSGLLQSLWLYVVLTFIWNFYGFIFIVE